MMRIDLSPQGSASWLSARSGKITASRIKDVMSTLKNGGETAARYGYKWELISERLSGFTSQHYVSPDMDRGNDLEPIARAEYEVDSGNMVDQVGLVYHPTIERSAASPDGLVDKNGAIEIKAPRSHKQLQWILAGIVPAEHQLQCLWVMECCEREWLDFSGFDPSLPEGLRMFTVRMYRDEERLAKIREEVVRFDTEIEETVSELRKRVKPSSPKLTEPSPVLADWPAAFGDFAQGEAI